MGSPGRSPCAPRALTEPSRPRARPRRPPDVSHAPPIATCPGPAHAVSLGLMAQDRATWTPLRGLTWGLGIAVVAGIIFGALGLLTLWLFGDEIVARELRLRELRRERNIGRRYLWHNHWQYTMIAPALIASLVTVAWLDRRCALGWVIEGFLALVAAAIGTGIMLALAQSIVQPWDGTVWWTIGFCGFGMGLVGAWESWRRSE